MVEHQSKDHWVHESYWGVSWQDQARHRDRCEGEPPGCPTANHLHLGWTDETDGWLNWDERISDDQNWNDPVYGWDQGWNDDQTQASSWNWNRRAPGSSGQPRART